MNRKIKTLLILMAIILIDIVVLLFIMNMKMKDACGMGVKPPIPPTVTVVLRWQPCFDVDLSGYRVYSVESGIYKKIGEVKELSAVISLIDVTELTYPTLYLFDRIDGTVSYEADVRQVVVQIVKDSCYVARSFDQFGHESVDSNKVCVPLYLPAEDEFNDPQSPDCPDCYCPTDDEMVTVLLNETYGQGEVVP